VRKFEKLNDRPEYAMAELVEATSGVMFLAKRHWICSLFFVLWDLGFVLCSLFFILWDLGFGICYLEFVIWNLEFEFSKFEISMTFLIPFF